MERSLLSVRSALVLFAAVLTGVGAGVLTSLAGNGAARSVLCGTAAFGLAVPFLDRLVAADADPGERGTAARRSTGSGGDHG
ncbi:hypothetical protein [Streptomyces sp. NPDC051569]|uniref:hypothetical protein n=1 Tax=Streptomyces sp. NPDC051569 TaxID=3365661 RepID=UPI0037AA597F